MNSILFFENLIFGDNIIEETFPGNIRKAKHFINFLRTIIEYIKLKISECIFLKITPEQFLYDFQEQTKMEKKQLKSLKFCHIRLQILFSIMS